MTTYWLTPADTTGFLVLEKDRFACEPVEEVAPFREKLTSIHPRLLMLFKAGTLLSDEEPSVCGSAGLELQWDNGKPIEFDGSSYVLSSCAEAFLDRLPSVEEVRAGLDQALLRTGWTPIQQMWLASMKEWTASGRRVLLIKEDGS
ncbi:hypothetical protein N6H14_23100 [Paenibacillus sp. CC-CFT747]|nr:hypothetical protein N6H14_23100 [Paenibacillus sp. CC-CFT747]